jgi:hypothetical protein
LYTLPGIIRIINSRRMRWAGHEARIESRRAACRLLLGNREGKRALGRSKPSGMDNIKMDLEERVWCEVDLIRLA